MTLRYILLFIFASFLWKGCSPSAENIIDVSHYDYPDVMQEISLQDYPSEGTPIEYLFIHCTASKEGVDLSLDWFLSFFKNERGWSRPGYHYLVLLDGTIEIMWPNNLDGYITYDEVVNGARGLNSKSLHISYVGGVDRFLAEKDTRTPAQKKSIDNLIQNIRCNIPNIQIKGHREVSSKSCPSFDVQKEYGYLNPILNKTELFDHQN